MQCVSKKSQLTRDVNFVNSLPISTIVLPLESFQTPKLLSANHFVIFSLV